MLSIHELKFTSHVQNCDDWPLSSVHVIHTYTNVYICINTCTLNFITLSFDVSVYLVVNMFA